MPTSLEKEIQTEVSYSTFGSCLFFSEALKNPFTVMLTNTLDIKLHADMVEKFDPFYYYYTATSQKNRKQLLLYTIQRCIRIYRTMYVGEFTLFHERSQWSCSHQSLTKTENFAVYAMPLCAHQVRRHTKKWYFLFCDDEGSGSKRDDSVRPCVSPNIYHQVNKKG